MFMMKESIIFNWCRSINQNDTEQIIKDMTENSTGACIDDDCEWIKELNSENEDLNKRRELLLMDEMDKICAESLDPETHLKWESIKAVLYNTRRNLKERNRR